MKSRFFRLQISIIMIVFAIIISFTITLIDHQRLKNEVKKNEQFQIEQIENLAKYSLNTIEKAYFLFEAETAAKMKTGSELLISKYEEQPNFEQWDFQDLKKMLEFDIYIINEDFVITHSSFQKDIGLDFNVCCRKLANVLEDRRRTGNFYDDGMDIEQQTGLVKKYSYMATRDKKYIIQLGYSLQDGVIFQQFNFLDAIVDLEKRYPSVDNINVLNIGGNLLGVPIEEMRWTEKRRTAFERTLSTKEMTELREELNGETAIYRYIPYTSEYDEGTTKDKVIEIVYNEKNLQNVLSSNKRTFYIQLSVVLMVAVVIALLIARWLAKPMYLAFHDSLTGLKNRAAFDESLRSALLEKKAELALVMLDLDNFKLVNDYYGHDKGDALLQEVARTIKTFAGTKDITARLGGDEFAMIIRSTNLKEIKSTADQMITAVRDICEEVELNGEQVTVSIGIAHAPEHGTTPAELYKSADTALYRSKAEGKNQFCFYQSENKRN
ncbi:GGDEF domain-containing protein [Alkalihalobacterium sp. APHAB7]|uniref:GGDEF domain-containing protein n=1 Tax=Alkalihalobacterium sp. APHAB7 TaxID=3402081 RepID=UPI003AAF296D